MKYSKGETAYLLGDFDTAGTVTISIYDLSNSSATVTSGLCTEVGTLGTYKYAFAPAPTTPKQYFWMMQHSGTLYSQKGIVSFGGGFVDTIDTISGLALTISGLTDTVESTLTTINNNTDTVEASLLVISGYVNSISGFTDTVESSLTTITTNLSTANNTLLTVSGFTDTLEGMATMISGYVVTISGYTSTTSATAIADAVWDELLSAHTVSGSASKGLTRSSNPNSY